MQESRQIDRRGRDLPYVFKRNGARVDFLAVTTAVQCVRVMPFVADPEFVKLIQPADEVHQVQEEGVQPARLEHSAVNQFVSVASEFVYAAVNV